MNSTIEPGAAVSLDTLVASTPHGIASRVLAKTAASNLTIFAFDAGQGLTEHTSTFEAFALVMQGTMTLTVGGIPVNAGAGTIVRMPAGVPHAVEATEAARMLLVMLRD
jgi:quercetin dioxygenase-like cupin family protein